MPKANADETHTVRLRKGDAARLKAATGQPFSRIIRFMVQELLAKYEAEGRLASARDALRGDVNTVVERTELPLDGQ
jgi:hypothetical protein